MSSLDWHPRYHRDALEGMRALSLEDRGAYNTLLDLMYERAGGVPDDERFVAGWLNCSIRLWRAIRARLLEAGKIQIEEGLIWNARVRLELDSQSARRRVNAESGATGGRKSAEKRAKPKHINDNAQAPAQAGLKLKTETETEGSEDKSSDADRVVPIDHDADAWRQAVHLLTSQGGQTQSQARSFFGRLISKNRIEPRDLLPSLAKATVTGTQDPQAYLAKAAEAIASRRTEAAKPRRQTWC